MSKKNQSKTMMQSVVIDNFAPSPHVRIMKKMMPRPRANEVLVKVDAAAINPIDIATATGLAHGGKIYPDLPASFPMSLGWDIAGTILEIGQGVKNWKTGDRVIAMVHQIASGFGVQGSHVVMPAELLAPWPSNIPAATIATLPLAGLTAYQAIQALRPKNGETVLINGPLGAVGSIATQLAVQAGARVVGVVRQDEQESAAALGITAYIERGTDIAKAVKNLKLSIDAALDVVGGGVAVQTLSAVRDNGRYVTLIPHTGTGLPMPVRGIVQQNVLIVPDALQLRQLVKLIELGKLKLSQPITLPLQNAQHAYDQMMNKQSHKKIVLI